MRTTTLLLVDDHAGFRARAKALLEAEGFDVVGEAADGQSALAAAERLRPDVALVDIGLPDIDGFAVASSIRDAGAARRVVLISGRAIEDFGDLLARSPADAFIAKADLTGERLHALLS
jgi:DNA-binding NarL/FixJ family response regulator